jgi:8-oxo-dGTP pyrophosphatase MutT (NUDIX family)
MTIVEPERVRVLLISPADRLLLIKYRNTMPDGSDRPCWTMSGGGMDPGETIAQAALREVMEETGLVARLGPVVWYGEDRLRSGDWNRAYREHFIVARCDSETIDRSRWTDHERDQIVDLHWWSLDRLRASGEPIFPIGLADRLAPVLRGDYPAEIVILPG